MSLTTIEKADLGKMICQKIIALKDRQKELSNWIKPFVARLSDADQEDLYDTLILEQRNDMVEMRDDNYQRIQDAIIGIEAKMRTQEP